MSLFITSLNSGSNGNCYYIGSATEAILVDAGISCREIEKRMKRLGLSMENVKAIFVSHEHADHINGIPVLSKKYKIPVYITEATQQGGMLRIEEELVARFQPHLPVVIGRLSITAFPKLHDASDPHSFIVSSETITVGIFTDIGLACRQVSTHFRKCHAVFLEANYDAVMLANGSYPIYLKNRIRGGVGHLSNNQALNLFMAHRPTFMSHILLSHLSKNNNNPELVYELFSKYAGNIKVIVASRYEETPVYHITGQGMHTGIKKQSAGTKLQLSLF